MKSCPTKYYKIFSSIPNFGDDYEKNIDFIKEKIRQLFVEDYYEQYPNSEVLEFNVNGYNYLFALSTQSEGNLTEIDDRVLAVYGMTSHTDEKKDTNRMKGFVGPFTKISRYKGFDKGHFISHKINGSLDQNLYPQIKELNRGWSNQGKLFRSLEKYCEQNPNVFLFTRPIYSDFSWIPEFIDYGIFTREFGVLLNRFDNRKKHTVDKK